MSLRSDLKEAMVVALERAGYVEHARQVKAELFKAAGDEMLGLAAQAALSVCDEYEEVEVQECNNADYLLRRPSTHWDPRKPSFTVYRKKQKPEPSMRETAARAAASLALCADDRQMSAGAFEHDDENRMDTTIVADAICEYYEKQLAAAIAKEGARRKHGST